MVFLHNLAQLSYDTPPNLVSSKSACAVYPHTYRHIDRHIHTYAHACMHACIHTYLHTYIHTYIHTYNPYMHTCMHACMHACIHTYIHTYIHAYIHTCVHAYMHTYMHTCAHTYIACLSLTPICTNLAFYIPYFQVRFYATQSPPSPEEQQEAVPRKHAKAYDFQLWAPEVLGLGVIRFRICPEP